MAEADKDGRIAEMVGDHMACLSMSLHEWLRAHEAWWADFDTRSRAVLDNGEHLLEQMQARRERRDA